MKNQISAAERSVAKIISEKWRYQYRRNGVSMAWRKRSGGVNGVMVAAAWR
jgi:hypothetical protein